MAQDDTLLLREHLLSHFFIPTHFHSRPPSELDREKAICGKVRQTRSCGERLRFGKDDLDVVERGSTHGRFSEDGERQSSWHWSSW